MEWVGGGGLPSDLRESSEYSSDSIDFIEKSHDSKDSIEWVKGGNQLIQRNQVNIPLILLILLKNLLIQGIQ